MQEKSVQKCMVMTEISDLDPLLRFGISKKIDPAIKINSSGRLIEKGPGQKRFWRENPAFFVFIFRCALFLSKNFYL